MNKWIWILIILIVLPLLARLVFLLVYKKEIIKHFDEAKADAKKEREDFCNRYREMTGKEKSDNLINKMKFNCN